MFKILSIYLDVMLKASIISACLLLEKDIIKSLSQQNRNVSATRGAQSVPIGIPTACLYNLVTNRIKVLSSKARGLKVSEYDQEIPQSQTANQTMAP